MWNLPRRNFRQICRSTLQRARDGWAAYGVNINWEDPSLYCAHSGERIESAYAEDDAVENGGIGELTVD